jgi:hypothetical protein
MWTVCRRGVAMVLLAGLASGCYESDFPLDAEPLIDLNPAYVATWRCLPIDGDPKEAPATLTITRGTRARLYEAVWQEDGDAPDRYEAYASMIQGSTFMNVRERGDNGPTGKWIFMRPALLRPNVLHLQVVADSGMAGVAKTPAAVRAAVERGRATATFFTEAALCARAKTEQ